MWERVRSILIKEFIQAFREPRMRMVIFVTPVIQLLIFGYAASNDVRDIATAVYDLDNTPASRELISRFLDSGYYRIYEYVQTEQRARQLIDRGQVRAVLHIDKGFSEDLNGGRTAQIQMIVDGVDSNNASIVLKYGLEIARQHSDRILISRIQHSRGAADLPGQVRLVGRAWFNENLESRNYYVPGVIANLVMLITLILTSMSIVREREIGTMEQLMVTPIRPFEFILGKTAPFALIGFMNVTLVTIVGVFWFKVPIRGSLPLLFGATALYLMSAVGLGLLISVICHTQQQAMMSTFFIFFPAMLLSGFVFPIANIPAAIRWITFANPLRYFLIIIRGVFLKGVGFDILWPQMAALAILGLILLSIASRLFHKTLD